MASRRKGLNPEDIFEELYADPNSDMEYSSSESETDTDEEEVAPTESQAPPCKGPAGRRPITVSGMRHFIHAH